MEEKEIRLDEVLKLETYLDYNQITHGPIHNYVTHRRRALEVDFPSEPVAITGTPEELREQAIALVKSKGYSQEAAEALVNEWGPERILAPETDELGTSDTADGQGIGEQISNEPPATPQSNEPTPANEPVSEQPPAEPQQS